MAKSQRRTRSPKINVGHAELREYSPSPEIWDGMEKALGKTIPTDTRAQIEIIIGRYFKERQLEVSAPSKKDVLRRIRAIRDAASKFQRVVLDAQLDVASGQPALSKIKVCMASPDPDADPFDDAQVPSSAATAILSIDSRWQRICDV